MHDVCGRLGVVIRPHGNGLVFEDVDRGVRVKASFVARELSKARLCKQLGSFQPASERQLEAARQAPHRYSPCRPGHPRACGRSTSGASTKLGCIARRRWGSYRDSASRERQQLRQKYRLQRERHQLPYPCQPAIDTDSYDNSRSGRPSKPEPSSESSQSNGRRFRRPGIRAPGATSSPAAPQNATPVRFDSCSTESGNATVSARKGSCEIQRDGVVLQIGNPNAVYGALQVDIRSYYREIRRFS